MLNEELLNDTTGLATWITPIEIIIFACLFFYLIGKLLKFNIQGGIP